MFRRLLTPDGTLIFADVIPPDVGALSDVSALLRYAAKHGFLVAALVGLVKTSVSPYRKIRSTLGIAQYTEAQFMRKLTDAGFTAERLARNMEHNPARMTFRAPAGVAIPLLRLAENIQHALLLRRRDGRRPPPARWRACRGGSRYSMMRSAFSPSAMSCGLCSVILTASCR